MLARPRSLPVDDQDARLHLVVASFPRDPGTGCASADDDCRRGQVDSQQTADLRLDEQLWQILAPTGARQTGFTMAIPCNQAKEHSLEFVWRPRSPSRSTAVIAP